MSRLPVGSSASTMAGRVISARAMATRCCSPPLSSEGRCSQPPLDRQQIAQMVEILQVQRLLAPADGVGDLDIAHGRERRQQVELLEDKADAVLAQPGALGVVERGKVHAVNDHAPSVACVSPPSR